MKAFLLKAGACALAVIPLTSFLIMWGVVNVSVRAMGYFVVAYLVLVLILLLRLILSDLLDWIVDRGR